MARWSRGHLRTIANDLPDGPEELVAGADAIMALPTEERARIAVGQGGVAYRIIAKLVSTCTCHDRLAFRFRSKTIQETADISDYRHDGGVRSFPRTYKRVVGHFEAGCAM